MEIRKDVVGYEGLYQISTLGRVKSLVRTGVKTGGNLYKETLRLFLVNRGYNQVVLTLKGIKYCFRVRRLVAQAFIPNPDNKPCVNHKNGIKTDNRVENLERCTISENTQHSFDNGLQKPNMKGRKGGGHPASKCVSKYTKDGLLLEKYDCITTAGLAMGKTKCSSINSCCKGKRKLAYGFVWKLL